MKMVTTFDDHAHVRKKGHSSLIRLSRSVLSLGAFFANARTAVPNPYQPGKATRACPHENPQGMARRSSMRWVARREAGREPMFSSAISAIGVAAKKNSRSE